MAFLCKSLLNLCLVSFIALLLPSQALRPAFKPKALVLPISKDPSTLQYTTEISQRTPLVPLKLTVDLGGRHLWVDCQTPRYISSTFKPARCNSAQCSLADSTGWSCEPECRPAIPTRPGCHKNTCRVYPENTVTFIPDAGQVGQDVVSLRSTDGSTVGQMVTYPDLIFACAPTSLLNGLAKGVKGMAGLGRNRVSLPSQFSNLAKKFALCLSSSTKNNGVLIFGDVTYKLFPNVYDSNSLAFTPLIHNPVSTSSIYADGEPSAEYFIGVQSIRIDGKSIPLNKTLLSINKQGYGGTKISTTYYPYTALHTSIYNSLVKEFTKRMQSQGVNKVEAVAPFEACFDSRAIFGTRVGPTVPVISLVLKNSKAHWNMFGSNSMVGVKKGVMCLGFVDGGWNPKTSVVVGGYQLENVLLQFDVAGKRLGFSPTLLGDRTSCAHFNITSEA